MKKTQEFTFEKWIALFVFYAVRDHGWNEKAVQFLDYDSYRTTYLEGNTPQEALDLDASYGD